MTKSMFRGVVWVMGVYFYFLIFAQFAFLEILLSHGLDEDAVKKVMGPMALGGVVGSFSVLWLARRYAWQTLMRWAAGLCAVMSLLVSVEWVSGSFGLMGFAGVACGIGLGLGVLTVLLASHLLDLFPGKIEALFGVALGTGIAYMNCNFPVIFQASPLVQSVMSTVVMLMLLIGVSLKSEREEGVGGRSDSFWARDNSKQGMRVFGVGVIVFTLLVWLDSSAFYIIQHNREIKMATWGDAMLQRNAVVHLIMALVAAALMVFGSFRGMLFLALSLLGGAGLMATHSDLQSLAGQLYPAGVSLYSVALVVYPAVYLGRKGAERRAAILFAVAGWIGSALGIGMAQDLNAVPMMFVGVAVAVIALAMSFSVWKHRVKEIAICVCVLALTAGVYFVSSSENGHERESVSLVDQGRQVYINEGCIHCHSKYVRPGSRDELLWGPVRDLEKVRQEQPVLIGNRRQGPDLMQVGLRRSKGWLKQHFMDPQSLEPKSTMPKYAFLFEDDRGDALIAYLSAYDSDDMGARVVANQAWQMPAQVRSSECDSSEHGRELFAEHCVACHGEQGFGDGALASLWARPPANLRHGPFPFTPAGEVNSGVSRMIKFGIPGMNMPGHETLSDPDLKALTNYVLELRKN